VSKKLAGMRSCGRSGQNLGLSGGDPPNPPYCRRDFANLGPLARVLGRAQETHCTKNPPGGGSIVDPTAPPTLPPPPTLSSPYLTHTLAWLRQSAMGTSADQGMRRPNARAWIMCQDHLYLRADAATVSEAGVTRGGQMKKFSL
jgi:hypothetical protein